ncbi:hypothetical protein T265_00209 [Opisthorchis viverrini]|uniref:Uncharacterized protein n=1 Tax=Opisthorchis viverrini TaxID=6198 RepID=A0A075AJV0_OPIVI|nr:hypothetical protein T265_00209 [Opisthorchis viverrini]KER34019.1 hypothetical protein T265_00209 [Opisthorchis viverrini]
MHRKGDKHAGPRAIRSGEEVYVKLQSSANESVHECVTSTSQNLMDMLLGRTIRCNLDHIRTRKHGRDLEQTPELTAQVDSGLKQEFENSYRFSKVPTPISKGIKAGRTLLSWSWSNLAVTETAAATTTVQRTSIKLLKVYFECNACDTCLLLRKTSERPYELPGPWKVHATRWLLICSPSLAIDLQTFHHHSSRHLQCAHLQRRTEDVSLNGDETFANQLPSSANRSTAT